MPKFSANDRNAIIAKMDKINMLQTTFVKGDTKVRYLSTGSVQRKKVRQNHCKYELQVTFLFSMNLEACMWNQVGVSVHSGKFQYPT